MTRAKLCPKCGVTKAIEMFTVCRSRPDGHAGHCRSCKTAYVRAWRRRKQLGDLRLEEPAGCAICGGNRGTRALAIDHDHRCCPQLDGSCGKCIRGFLCGPCNRGLGFFGDNVAYLRAAVRYLDRGPHSNRS